jgi:hypothetical protein
MTPLLPELEFVEVTQKLGDIELTGFMPSDWSVKKRELAIVERLINILARDGSNKDGGVSEGQRLLNIRSYILKLHTDIKIAELKRKEE